MKVKIIPSLELGDVQPETLTLFGQAIGRGYTKVQFTDEQVAKVRGNRFFHIEGDPLDHDGDGKKGGSVKASNKHAETAQTSPAPAPVDDEAAELAAVRARLDEGEVPYDGRLGLDKLKVILAEAEAAPPTA